MRTQNSESALDVRYDNRERWCSVLVLTLLLAVQLVCLAQNGDSNQIVAAFTTYKQAVLAQKGEDAVAVVNRKTLDYFGQMLDRVRHSPRSEVEKLRTADKLLVLRARHQIKADDLKKMTATNFFACGIDRGWTAKDSVVNLELGRVDVVGDIAKAELAVSGKKAPPSMAYVFIKEDGKWRLDMLPMMARADQMFKQMIRQQEVKEDEFLFDVIESVSGTKVSQTVWNPIMKDKK